MSVVKVKVDCQNLLIKNVSIRINDLEHEND